MTLPYFCRDAVGLSLVWGEWQVSRYRSWRFGHVSRGPNMGATRVDVWTGLGLRFNRVRRAR